MSVATGLEKKGGIGAVVFAVFLGFVFVGSIRHDPKSVSTSTTRSVAKPAPPFEGAGLADITVQVISLNKVGFGNILEATFSIANRNRYAIKDITVTCKHAANSGSFIDSNTRTIYELISASGSTYVNKFNMGFINSQANGSTCNVTGFTRV